LTFRVESPRNLLNGARSSAPAADTPTARPGIELDMLLPVLALVSPLIVAATEACAGDAAEIRVVERIASPRIDHAKTVDQLRTMALGETIAGNRRFSEIAGLTVAGIAVDTEIRIANTRLSTGDVCVWPSVVTVTLSTAPAVYVTADHGACQLAAALDHEMRHVAVDRQIIHSYAQILRKNVDDMAQAIGTAGPLPAANLPSVRRRIEEKLNAAIAVASERLNAERASEQREIDSPQEYQRLVHQCPGGLPGRPKTSQP
jgi:hypothetical protein